MADFARWATACEGAFCEPGTFRKAYRQNRRKATLDVLDADPVATAIVALMNYEASWEGTSTELLDRLEGVVGEKEARRKDWPTSAAALGARLRRIATRLRRLSIKVDFDREGHKSKRIITISRSQPAKAGKMLSAPSALSEPPENKALPTDGSRRHAVGMLSAEPLENKASDSADSADSNFRLFSVKGHTPRKPFVYRSRGKADEDRCLRALRSLNKLNGAK
jgi:hypothetical protein